MPHPFIVAEPVPAGGYLSVRLSRPDRRNALDPAMTAALLDCLAAEPDRTVLLGSSEPGAFCAGADLSLPDAGRAAVADLLYRCCEIMITRPGPVLAVLSGPAVGGGALLAAASDLRIAGPAARLRWTGPPGAGLAVGAWVLPDLVGRGAALDLTLTGRWVGAAEALALGLVNRVEADPEPVAADLAATLAAADPAAAGRVKLITAAGGLLDRLRAERRANAAAWAAAADAWQAGGNTAATPAG
jgi:enoyl-CoA hydratase/carnithine racemase